MITIYYPIEETVNVGILRDLFFHPNKELCRIVADLFRQGKYQAVAEFQNDNLEAAYCVMQNGAVTESWVLEPPENLKPMVKPHIVNEQEFGWRSAKIGDVFVVSDKAYVCVRKGFLPLN